MNHSLKNVFLVCYIRYPMNRLVQIKTVEAALHSSLIPARPAFRTIKRLLQIQLAIVCQMPQVHKHRSAQFWRLATIQLQLTTKTTQNLRWMPVVLTFLEVVAKAKQKIALAAVCHAIKWIHPHMVHYAKVAIIIGGIRAALVTFFIPNSHSHHLILFTNALQTKENKFVLLHRSGKLHQNYTFQSNSQYWWCAFQILKQKKHLLSLCFVNNNGYLAKNVLFEMC